MKTVIISLNCVIDTHYYFESFTLNEENFIKEVKSFAGGKGVNVTKALQSFSASNKLFLLLGKQNADAFEKLLSAEGIEADVSLSDGRIRENISLHSKEFSETRVCSKNFYATDEDCINTLEKAFEVVEYGDVVVISGRFPDSASKEKIIPVIKRFSEKNVHLILDSTFFDLSDFSVLKPFMIKPNEHEIKAFCDDESKSVELLLDAGVENVIISKGEKGAELYTENQAFIAIPPSVTPLSTVGAGDSFVGGFAYALMQGSDVCDCLKNGVLWGTSCCLTEGGKPPCKEIAEDIYKKITITSLK